MIPQKQTEHKSTNNRIYPKQSPNGGQLNQILELTEQNQSYRIQNKKQEQDAQISNQKTTCIAKACNFLARIFTQCFHKDKLAEVDVNQSQMSRLLDKLRNKKNGYPIVLPPLKDKKKTLVLDMDETLIHTSFRKVEHYDFQIDVIMNKKKVKVYVSKRFGLDAFLFEMSQIYQVIIFTAGQRQYADQILNKIDPKNWISHRLYRQHCIVVNKIYHLKNLKILGRDMSDIIIVDDNRMGGILQPDNYYRIEPFLGSVKDRKLVRLAAFLKYINKQNDVRRVCDFKKKFEQTEIKLKQNIVETNSHDYKRKFYKHRKKDSEVEALAQTDSNIITQQTQYEHQQTNVALVIR